MLQLAEELLRVLRVFGVLRVAEDVVFAAHRYVHAVLQRHTLQRVDYLLKQRIEVTEFVVDQRKRVIEVDKLRNMLANKYLV